MRLKRKTSVVIVGFLALLFIASALLVYMAASDANNPAPTQMMTLNPQIIANLTALPQTTPISGEAAQELIDLRESVEACEDYVPQRRDQMLQHIQWLLNPADIPQMMIIALGANPNTQLIFGMATFTSSQWRLLEQPADSCLVPIGRRLNEMLAAAGAETFDIYDG